MIPHGVEVFVALDTIDLRWSFDRLGAMVEGHLGREVRGGALFVFFGRRRDAVKILFADDSGLLLKRKGRHLRAGEAEAWTPDFFVEAHGLYRLRGTVQYPEAA